MPPGNVTPGSRATRTGGWRGAAKAVWEGLEGGGVGRKVCLGCLTNPQESPQGVPTKWDFEWVFCIRFSQKIAKDCQKKLRCWVFTVQHEMVCHFRSLHLPTIHKLMARGFEPAFQPPCSRQEQRYPTQVFGPPTTHWVSGVPVQPWGTAETSPPSPRRRSWRGTAPWSPSCRVTEVPLGGGFEKNWTTILRQENPIETHGTKKQHSAVPSSTSTLVRRSPDLGKKRNTA